MSRLCLALAAAAVAVAQPKVDFNREIRPILSDNCFACHGPDEAKRAAGLRLDTEEGALGRKSLIVPGQAAASRIMSRIAAEKPGLRMPPPATDKKLTPKQIELIGRWIDEGAEWKTHWAFQPPKRLEPPVTKRPGWVRNPIDAFVLARLEKEGLQPSPEASRAALLRRVSLDLTGLPPSQEELRSYLADKSPSAYEKRVDKLLATPQHAERMALQWLDLARYADTHGYHIDSHRDMWPWRDWVIRAFESNMPFDRFTIEQLAGDLLPGATRDQKLATGFNRNHMINFEGGAIPEEYQVEYVVDRVETTSTVWMGLTMGCARCHDHKYDPIKQSDFYRMFAFFNTIPEKGLDGRMGNAEPYLRLATAEQEHRRDSLRKAIREREDILCDETVEPLIERWERDSSLPDDPREGLISHWELDGGLVDSSGGYRRAAFTKGTASFGRGYINGAAELDGESTLDFGKVEQFSSGKPFTLAFSVRASGSQATTLLRQDGLEISFGDMIPAPELKRMSQVIVQLRLLGKPVELQTLDRIERGPWHHIAITSNGDFPPIIYLNGRKARTEASPLPQPSALQGPETLQAGNKKFGKALKGSLDDVRIYDRALTASELERLAIHWPIKALRFSDFKRAKDEAARVRKYFLEFHAPENLRTAHLELEELLKQLKDLDRTVPTTMVMAEMGSPRKTFILGRGDYRNKTERVSSGVPSVLPPLPTEGEANRLALAKWLVSPSHPLTSRVAVNRFWQMYFGAGLVKTAEDFGSQGEAPSHPELLDWLATEFIRTGWDVRAMQRLIVTSATYRQASEVSPQLLERDPENRLLARGSRFRLQAELVRDNALAISGLLNLKVGGPSVSPYEPDGVWDDLAYGDVFSAQKYVQSSGGDLYRRSMYTFWKRTVPPSSMSTFDAPDREKCVARRSVTNTPLQALVLMNDPTFVEASRAFAAAMIRAGKDARRRLDFAFERALSRRPAAAELSVLTRLAKEQRAAYRQNPKLASQLIRVGDSLAEPSIPAAELAAWTVVAGTILNMDETITRE